MHSGSAVDSDSTCGSSILSSPTRKPSDSFRWLFCFVSRCVFGPVRHKALIFSRLPGLYCFLMQQGNTEDRTTQMSIWDAFGKGRYKGFSREAGQLLDKAVELAGGLGCKRQTPATCCGRCCKRTAARRPAFWPGRTSRSWKCGVSCPPGGMVRSPGLPGAIWRRTCAGRWTTPSSGRRTPT